MTESKLSHLKDNDYSRENLIAICEAATTDVRRWRDRDSPSAHEKLGKCWSLLKCNCDFTVFLKGPGDCVTNERTIWLEITYPSFSSFECGDDAYDEAETFYLPTPKRLRDCESHDWY